jgi:xyloglucan:xyloglucosyl transferase
MGSRRRHLAALVAPVAALLLLLLSCSCRGASAAPATSFGDNFEITGAEDHVKTSADGQTWYLYLDNKTGTTRKGATFKAGCWCPVQMTAISAPVVS